VTTTSKPAGAHIVGRIPLDGPEEVFRAVSQHAGPLLRSMPDGETETGWIVQQFEILDQMPQLDRRLRMVGGMDTPTPSIVLRDGVRAEDVTFPDLGYARVAARSFEILSRLKGEGVVRGDMRLQVNLPSPKTVTGILVHEDDAKALAAEYERAMIREVARVLDVLPHEQLTIGWDIPAETVALEGGSLWKQLPFDPSETAIVGDLSRLAAAIPGDVPLGFHVCLGSMGNKHVVIPEDARNQVSLMNRLTAELARPVDWLHAPVPRDADPELYLAPYSELRLPGVTALYLGLIDIADGRDATQRRIEAAQSVLPAFGVGTVCGLGGEFYSRDDIIETLSMYAALAEPIAAS
jgi:hypothetical protein